MKFTESTRNAIRQRAGSRCEVCGLPADLAQIHHRRPRGMGGTKRRESGGAANGLLLHPACHERIERNRAAALENGWLVSQTADPAEVPVRLWDGWALLNPAGSVTRVGEPTSTNH